MKTLQATDLQITNRQYKIDAVIRQIESILQEMQFPDVEGIQIYQLLSDNLQYEGDGVYAIVVDKLAGAVELVGSPHSVWLRNHAGVLQFSNDYSTWTAVGGGGSGGGSGDMAKATYDPQDAGRVLVAEELADGTHSTTAEQMQDHRGDGTIHFIQGDIDHVNIQNRGSHTHADIDAFMDAGGSLPEVFELPIQSTAPAAEANKTLLYGKQGYTSTKRALPSKRGSRPMDEEPIAIPYFKYSDNIERKICTLGSEGKLDDADLSANVMLKGAYEYAAGEPFPNTVVGTAARIYHPGATGILTAAQLAEHLAGISSRYLDGQVLNGIAVATQTQDAPWINANVALIYGFAVTAGEPAVTTYELRVVFPDGTRRRIVTEEII